MSMFDRDYLGHYLRLIRQVRVSLIALIPPSQNIHATLSTTGSSRVVFHHGTFQNVNIQRGPELVALSSPMNATGLFELGPQPESLILFEGIGVDTAWEFSLPKAANLIDLGTIADVLIIIEYTALYSDDYRRALLRTIDSDFSADRGFSFRNEFPDHWYDLHNPELSEENQQFVIQFRTERDDFPPNLESLSIRQVVPFFGSENSQRLPIQSVRLLYTPGANGAQEGGDAKPLSGKISTGSGAWNNLIGKSLPTEWVMSFQPDSNDPLRTKKLKDLTDRLRTLAHARALISPIQWEHWSLGLAIWL
jgi:hypothetical protein